MIEGEMSRRLRRNSIVRDKTNSLVKKNLRTSLTDVINRDLLTDCLATAAADRNEITILEVNNQFQFLKLCTLIVFNLWPTQISHCRLPPHHQY